MVSAHLKHFARSESGAVTVDWVVLTASVALLGAFIVFNIKAGQDNIGEQVGENLSTAAETMGTPNFE